MFRIVCCGYAALSNHHHYQTRFASQRKDCRYELEAVCDTGIMQLPEGPLLHLLVYRILIYR